MDLEGSDRLRDGHKLEFASQRNFNTLVEAEDYLRPFVCARIDSHLNSA